MISGFSRLATAVSATPLSASSTVQSKGLKALATISRMVLLSSTVRILVLIFIS